MRIISTKIGVYLSLSVAAALSFTFLYNGNIREYPEAKDLEWFECAGIASQAHISGFMFGNEDDVFILVVWMGRDWNLVSCVNEIGGARSKGVQDVINESHTLSVGQSQYDGAEFEAMAEEGIELGALVFDAKEKVAFIGMNRRKNVERQLVYTRDEVFPIKDGNVFYIDSEGNFSQLPFRTKWIQKDELDIVLQFLEPSLYGDWPLPEEVPDGISLEPVSM